jgi:serine phosphatase RsbU (regulator of sigma subunit)
MVPLDFAEPERPMRASRGRSSGGGGGGGPFIGVMIPLVVAVAAAIMAVVGGFWVASSANKGVFATLDRTGVGTALALSIGEPEMWEREFGVGVNVYELFHEKYQEKIRKLRARADPDERDEVIAKQEFDELVESWNLAPDPLAAERDVRTREANEKRLEKLVSQQGTPVLWAGILRAGGGTIYRQSGKRPALRVAGSATQIGEVTVTPILATFDDGRLLPARHYKTSIKDKFGSDGGEVEVILTALDAVRATAGSMMPIILSGLLALLVVGGVAMALCMGASSGIKRVNRDLDAIAGGDLDVRVRTGGGGEVGALAKNVDRAMKTFRAVQSQTVMQAAAPVATAGAGIDTASLLPTEPPRIEGFEIEAVHKATMEGANDFYDFIEVDDNHLGVVIADLPHAGPQGAYTAATFRALFRAYAIGEPSPAAVLGRVNRVMAGELKRGDHISAMYTVLDISKGILAVASAGHLPLIFWKFSKKGSALLNPEGIAIGLDKGPVFEKTVVDKRIKLEKGDRYVLYTDGALAAQNMAGEEYGEQRFYYLVSREAPKNSAAFVNFVANEVDLFHEGAAQQDDITIVTVRKLGD